MMKMMKHILACLFLLMGGQHAALAQGGFSPDNPPEPQVEYTVTVSATPSDVAYTSGGGKYAAGTTVRVSTSARSTNFAFHYWVKDGEVYTTNPTFTYSVEGNAHFVAVYRYNPSNPAEPSYINQYRLYLESDMDGSCSFNRTSGSKVDVGARVSVRAYPNQYYTFQGWYEGDEKVSDSNPFTYTMPERNVTLTAHFTYDDTFNPGNPGEPSTGQDEVDNSEGILGDVNGDGEVNIADAVDVVGYVLGTPPLVFRRNLADMDGDGIITVTDAQLIIQYILNR